MTSQVNLVDGPSKFDLMTALFVWKPERPKVEFKADNGTVFRASINACEAEDGSGECWNIRGYATCERAGILTQAAYKGFFRTSSPRTGFLIFE